MAYTRGPGLIGALMVGANLARGLAWARDLPLLGVHMEGHLLAPMLATEKPELPLVALLVVGRAYPAGRKCALSVYYRILGQTLDDAVGEAFDKTPNCSDCRILAGRSWRRWPIPCRIAIRFSATDDDPTGLDFIFQRKTAALSKSASTAR